MKTIKSMKTFMIALVAGIIAISCSSDDDNTPEVINEEEVITTVRVQLANDVGFTTTLQSVDSDGDGPEAPVITIEGDLFANTTYTGVVTFLNETESPAENITLEVAEEADEHQVFYTPADGLNITTVYNDQDSNGNPLGILFTLTTGEASNGNFTVTLRHEPTKPNNGLADAGGDTDVEVTFDVTIQ
ncbi:type 1 periplasmic binding fold superfamily protein [uncultured Dokdonia sp.]|uniref:type 1 periplasmic binding fold superfamily protein n=1 Tax=uncultured Dokdonia sp. TaxID=575653 RepID=UPI002614FC0C|nr:type 1 periplasmic binding fold superfamily protein [uncultured Dokdonia sp.]